MRLCGGEEALGAAEVRYNFGGFEGGGRIEGEGGGVALTNKLRRKKPKKSHRQ